MVITRMKTSVTLTFDSHVLANIKKSITAKSLSSFTNNLYADWLRAKEKEELIAAYRKISEDKVYKEFGKLAEGITIEAWNEIDKREEAAQKRRSLNSRLQS